MSRVYVISLRDIFSYSSLAFETFAKVSLIGTHNCFHRSLRCDRFSACIDKGSILEKETFILLGNVVYHDKNSFI